MWNLYAQGKVPNKDTTFNYEYCSFSLLMLHGVRVQIPALPKAEIGRLMGSGIIDSPLRARGEDSAGALDSRIQ